MKKLLIFTSLFLFLGTSTFAQSKRHKKHHKHHKHHMMKHKSDEKKMKVKAK